MILTTVPSSYQDATAAKTRRLARLDGGVLAVVGGALGDGLGLVAGGGALELLADGLDRGGAGARDGGRVAKVGVDARQDLAVVGLDVLDDDVALDAVLAVAAGAVLQPVNTSYGS